MALPIFIGEKMAKHILSCSFGKDSIATALLALQHGEPLDELVYCEVMFSEEISGELPEHNRFIHETAIPYFEQRGIPTRVLRSEKTYLSCFYHVVTRGKTKGMLSGFPLSGRCTIQRDCKLPPIKAYQKALPPDTVQYIGIAADEPKRLARLKPGQISLLDKYHVAEPEARSMRHISRSEGHLISFFRQLMKHGVKVVATEYNIEYRAANFKLGRKIDRFDPRFSETAPREYYRQLHHMPTEMQQEYRQENTPAKPKWQPTELQPTVRRARYLGKLPRRYPKVSGFMACYYHYCALLRKAYHGKSTKRCYFLLREDFLLFSRYQQQTKFLWENHIETMDELLAYKENAEAQIQQLARQRKVLYRQKREPERAARDEKIKSLTQQMKALRHEVYICSDIETDAAEVQEKLRQAELAAQEERNEVKQYEQRRRSSRSDGAGSLTGYRSSH